jgi:hypothetical protein
MDLGRRGNEADDGRRCSAAGAVAGKGDRSARGAVDNNRALMNVRELLRGPGLTVTATSQLVLLADLPAILPAVLLTGDWQMARCHISW